MDSYPWENLAVDDLIQHVESGFIFKVYKVNIYDNQGWITAYPLKNYTFPNGDKIFVQNKYQLSSYQEYELYTEPEEEFNRLSVIE